ncbi:MAG TPA: undecaprenyl-diphosphate phosphatase [Burkholderiaceae bacterium]|nr:undecaprenyl-diphosphate phosphatase [Burkholderiaceae bacterium]
MALSPAEAAALCAKPEAIDLGFAQLTWLQVTLLGVIQGITELLPISSTAHLRVIPGLLGWRDPGSAFSAAMQLAAFCAVVVYFRLEIAEIGVEGGRQVLRRDFKGYQAQMLIGIVLGTIPLLVAGAALRSVLNACNSPLRGLMVIGFASVAMSLLLAIAERVAQHTRELGEVRLRDGLIVGLAQAFALIPGVSRSGATLTAGLFCGMNRETAAKFSFLLGLPAITLAGFHEIWVLYRAGLDAHGWATLLVGLLSASLTSFAAIYGLLHYLEKRSTWIFVWYRFALGVALVVGIAGGMLQN